MKPQCIRAVNQAAGRVLSSAEIRGIDDRIQQTMTRIARQDPDAWRALPMDQRVLQAAKAAQLDLAAEAARKLANVQRQVLATASTASRIDALKVSEGGPSAALVADINNTQLYIEGVKRQNVSQLMDLVDAAGTMQGTGIGRRALMFLFDATNPQMTRDLVTEIFANGKGGTGNQIARAGAEAWLKVTDGMRQRFNAAGGDVGKLAYGYLPQPHDAGRVRSAGVDSWVARTMPLLDRKQYVRADGAAMNDSELGDFLRAAYQTIATDGLNKTEAGQFTGSGAKANKGSEARKIHFKDGESYQTYLSEYGRGSMYDAMLSHIGGLARDIGLVERYGPNPNAQFRLQNDLAARAEKDLKVKRVFGNKPQAYWDIVSGVTGSPESARLAQIGQDIRNVQTFGKLAGAVVSSLTDLSTMLVTTGYNKLSYWDLFRNVTKQTDSETRDFLTQHGVIAETMLGDINRWAGENIANNWSGRVANGTMKLSLMNLWTDTMRRGFSMTMMQGLAKLSTKKWGELSEWDRSHLGRKGITEADWDVVAAAQLTDFQGRQFLTPEAIMAADIAKARPADLQRIRDDVDAQTADLTARNDQDQAWIRGRLDKFDQARDALNRAVKARAGKRQADSQKTTGVLLERMALLDAQREAAKLQADLEADYNKLFTAADVQAFNTGLREAAADLGSANRQAVTAAEKAGQKFGERRQRLEQKMREAEASAGRGTEANAERQLIKMTDQDAQIERAALERDIEVALKTIPAEEQAAFRAAMDGVGQVRASAAAGISAAEKIGRKYGEAKGRLDRRMVELQNRIGELDRTADRATSQDAKAAAAKADEMLADLRTYIQRSQERQQRRTAVVDRLNQEVAGRQAAEGDRIKNEVVSKILGFITDESEYAVMNPDLATKAIQTWGGMQTGTIPGELARLTMQFKSFPIAMISRHWRRMLGGNSGLDGAPVLANRAAYATAMAVTTTALGALVFQAKQLKDGKDPVDMTTPKFWARAVAQGGGAGFLGDMILGDTTEDRGQLDSLGRIAFGPTFGSAAELWELTKGNIDEAIAGKDTHIGAEGLRFAKGHLPYVNLWYAKAGIDHLLLHNLQENLSPGYLARVQNKARKDWGQGYWWKPGEAVPDRLPGGQ